MRQLDEEVAFSNLDGEHLDRTDVEESCNTMEEVEPTPLKVFESQAEKLFDPRSVAEIEAEFLKKQETDALNAAKNMKPEDLAAQGFGMFLPLYFQHVSRLSNKEARRVLEHLVEYPLHSKEMKFSTEDGRAAFALGQRLLECKNIMIATIEIEKLQKQMDEKQAEEDLARASTETNVAEATQGETNGETQA